MNRWNQNEVWKKVQEYEIARGRKLRMALILDCGWRPTERMRSARDLFKVSVRSWLEHS